VGDASLYLPTSPDLKWSGLAHAMGKALWRYFFCREEPRTCPVLSGYMNRVQDNNLKERTGRQGYCNPNVSDDAIAAYIGIIVRGMNANPELGIRTHHDAKLFHDMMLIVLFGFGVKNSATA